MIFGKTSLHFTIIFICALTDTFADELTTLQEYNPICFFSTAEMRNLPLGVIATLAVEETGVFLSGPNQVNNGSDNPRAMHCISAGSPSSTSTSDGDVKTSTFVGKSAIQIQRLNVRKLSAHVCMYIECLSETHHAF